MPEPALTSEPGPERLPDQVAFRLVVSSVEAVALPSVALTEVVRSPPVTWSVPPFQLKTTLPGPACRPCAPPSWSVPPVLRLSVPLVPMPPPRVTLPPVETKPLGATVRLPLPPAPTSRLPPTTKVELVPLTINAPLLLKSAPPATVKLRPLSSANEPLFVVRASRGAKTAFAPSSVTAAPGLRVVKLELPGKIRVALSRTIHPPPVSVPAPLSCATGPVSVSVPPGSTSTVPALSSAHCTWALPVPVWTKLAPAALVNTEPVAAVMRLALSCNVKVAPAWLFQWAVPVLLSERPAPVPAGAKRSVEPRLLTVMLPLVANRCSLAVPTSRLRVRLPSTVRVVSAPVSVPSAPKTSAPTVTLASRVSTPALKLAVSAAPGTTPPDQVALSVQLPLVAAGIVA